MTLQSSSLTQVSSNYCFGGWQHAYRHASNTTNCEMTFGIYLPPQAETQTCPVLYWLSGLTCTEQNFITKAGAQAYAAKYGIAIVAPDTSPRGCNLPGEDDDWDFGSGAGFYVNATQAPWSQHYRMYDYVVSELPTLIKEQFPVDDSRKGIFGHSMGGHGALIVALKNPGMFRSVSAFAPIVAPSQVPWGQKAFRNYLGDNLLDWETYDASILVKHTETRLPILIDQGEDDPFLANQLKPELFEAACADVDYPLQLRRHPDYDHSYCFIASFMEEHIHHHAEAML